MPSTSSINNMEAMIMSTLKLCQQSIETVRCLASTSNQPTKADFNLLSAYAAQQADSHGTATVSSTIIDQQQNSGQFQFGFQPSATLIPSQSGILASSISITDMVHPEVRRQILSGKHVNLNILLMPNFQPSKRPSKELDERLSRNLSLDEFIVAFGRFKRIMVAAFANRSQELDDYMAHIIETANIWPEKFYKYHKLFSAKCATVLYQRNQIIDWSYGDPGLRQLVCAGSRVRNCDTCRSTVHVSAICVLWL
ncbi:hypothetical protein SNE40_007859 [Patella caerulea]|uniref:Uncharacterized protein n=1 Tax=Patella caerulea TaxID=87958 RepID=A0AAN8JZL6_PATCE